MHIKNVKDANNFKYIILEIPDILEKQQQKKQGFLEVVSPITEDT